MGDFSSQNRVFFFIECLFCHKCEIFTFFLDGLANEKTARKRDEINPEWITTNDLNEKGVIGVGGGDDELPLLLSLSFSLFFLSLCLSFYSKSEHFS